MSRVDATALAPVAGGNGTAVAVATGAVAGAYHNAASVLSVNGSAGMGGGEPPPGADSDVAVRDGGAVELSSANPGGSEGNATLVGMPNKLIGDLAKGDGAAELPVVALDDAGVNARANDASALSVGDLTTDDPNSTVTATDAPAAHASNLTADNPSTGLPIVILDDAGRNANLADAPAVHASNMTTDGTSADLPSANVDDAGTTASSTVTVSKHLVGGPARDAGAADLPSEVLDDSTTDAGAENVSSVPLGDPARDAGAAPADAPVLSPIDATRGFGVVSGSVTGSLPVDEVTANATGSADGVIDGPEAAMANGTAGGGTDAAPETSLVAVRNLGGGEDAVTAAVPSPAAAVPRIIVAAFSANRTSLELLVDRVHTAEATSAVCRVVPYAADGVEGTPFLLRSSPRVDAAATASAGSVTAISCSPLPADVVQAVVSWSADGVGGWSGSRMVVPPLSVQAAATTESSPEDSGGDVSGGATVAAIDPAAGPQPHVGPTAPTPDGGVNEMMAAARKTAAVASPAVTSAGIGVVAGAAGLGAVAEPPGENDGWAVTDAAGVPADAGDGSDAGDGGGIAESAASGSGVDAVGDSSGSDGASASGADVPLGQLPSAIDTLEPVQPNGGDMPTGAMAGAAAAASTHPGADGADGAAAVDGVARDSLTDVAATDGTTAGVAVEAAADVADDPVVAHPFDPADTYEASSMATGAPVAAVAAAPTAAELAAAAGMAAQAAMDAYAMPSVKHATGKQEGWPDAALADAAAASRAASAARSSPTVVPTVVDSHSRVPLFVLLAVAGSLYASLRRVRARRGVLPAWTAGWSGGDAASRRFHSTATAGLMHAVASAAVAASGLLGLVSLGSAEAGRGGRRGGSPLNGAGPGGGRGVVGGPSMRAAPATTASDEESVPAGATGGATAKTDDSWEHSWGPDNGEQPDRREEPWSPTTWAAGATTTVGRRSKDRAD